MNGYAIEQGGDGGTPLLFGIIIAGVGSGEDTTTLVEYIGPSQLQWVQQIRSMHVNLEADADGDGIPDYVEMGLELPVPSEG